MNKHTRSVSLIDGHTEDKTDAEIKKALECCLDGDWAKIRCNKCYFDKRVDCIGRLRNATIDLINRKDAEIERYKAEHKDFVRKLGDLHSMTIMVMDRRNEIKSEAIKEFAERLTDKADLIKANAFDSRWAIWQDDIDNLVKEMTEVSE